MRLYRLATLAAADLSQVRVRRARFCCAVAARSLPLRRATARTSSNKLFTALSCAKHSSTATGQIKVWYYYLPLCSIIKCRAAVRHPVDHQKFARAHETNSEPKRSTVLLLHCRGQLKSRFRTCATCASLPVTHTISLLHTPPSCVQIPPLLLATPPRPLLVPHAPCPVRCGSSALQ